MAKPIKFIFYSSISFTDVNFIKSQIKPAIDLILENSLSLHIQHGSIDNLARVKSSRSMLKEDVIQTTVTFGRPGRDPQAPATPASVDAARVACKALIESVVGVLTSNVTYFQDFMVPELGEISFAQGLINALPSSYLRYNLYISPTIIPYTFGGVNLELWSAVQDFCVVTGTDLANVSPIGTISYPEINLRNTNNYLGLFEYYRFNFSLSFSTPYTNDIIIPAGTEWFTMDDKDGNLYTYSNTQAVTFKRRGEGTSHEFGNTLQQQDGNDLYLDSNGHICADPFNASSII